MILTEWAKAQGIHLQTARRWFHEGMLLVPAMRVGPRTILVNIEANQGVDVVGGVGLYAWVSSRDQKADLERQATRLVGWAAQAGHRVVRTESEIASGMNGGRAKVRRLLADPAVMTVAVEQKDRLGRTNIELVEAVLAAHGRRSARNRVQKALEAAASERV